MVTHGLLCYCITFRYTTRIAEMKEKLEQANSSAKSMQSYVQFLKTSYASVFHEPTDQPITF